MIVESVADRDKRLREDADWVSAAAHYRDIKLVLATHTSETGGGVTVTQFWRAGAINYKVIPELGSVDLEEYRSAPRQETRITVVDP